MKFPNSIEQLPTNGARSRVYGEPFQTADGATVIPVSKVRADSVTPTGVFVVQGGTTRWIGAVDTDRIALIGIITGLIAAVLGSLAVLRRPPWPDLSATSGAWSQHRPPRAGR